MSSIAKYTLAAILALAGSSAGAAELQITVPGGPGSGQDQFVRAIARALTEEGLAENVSVYNVTGGAGQIALAQFISSGEGNGDALIAQGIGMVISPISNKTDQNLSDVTQLARLVSEYEVVVTRSDSGIETMDDLVERYRQSPREVTFAAGGIGGTAHVFATNIVMAADLDPSLINLIPFANTGEIVVGLLSGEALIGLGGYQDFGQQVQTGKLRVLGLAGPERLPAIDAPTLREQSLDVVFSNWRGVSAHPSLTEEQLAALDQTFAALAQSDTWNEILEQRSWLNSYLPREEYRQFVADEQKRAEESLRKAGVID